MRLLVWASLSLLSVQAAAQVSSFKGSDTLAGVMTDAIVAGNLDGRLAYLGGGSGTGEDALVAGLQGMAAMSRPFKEAKLKEAAAKGLVPVEHVLGLDGIGVFINQANLLEGASIEDIRKIFMCELREWNAVVGSATTGTIKVYRRDDHSGTTDTFKSLVGITSFGSCVTVVAETADIAYQTANDALAIGYAGLSARRDTNRPMAIARAQGGVQIKPTVASIRNGSYPLARKLYLYEASASMVPNSVEREFIDLVTDRSFMDPILLDHDFYTLD